MAESLRRRNVQRLHPYSSVLVMQLLLTPDILYFRWSGFRTALYHISRSALSLCAGSANAPQLASALPSPLTEAASQQPDRSLGDAFESFLTEACGSWP